MRGGDEVSEPLSGSFVMAVEGRGESFFQTEIIHPKTLIAQCPRRAPCQGETGKAGLAYTPRLWEGLTLPCTTPRTSRWLMVSSCVIGRLSLQFGDYQPGRQTDAAN